MTNQTNTELRHWALKMGLSLPPLPERVQKLYYQKPIDGERNQVIEAIKARIDRRIAAFRFLKAQTSEREQWHDYNVRLIEAQAIRQLLADCVNNQPRYDEEKEES